MHDQMVTGRRFRVLNIVDDVTRECLAAVPDTSISGKRLARELTILIARRGKPCMIVSDNGTELTSNAVLEWCSKAHVPEKLAAWVDDYNTRRPHASLGYATPATFAANLKKQGAASLRIAEGYATQPLASLELTRNNNAEALIATG